MNVITLKELREKIDELLKDKSIIDSEKKIFFGKITLNINDGKKVNINIEQSFK